MTFVIEALVWLLDPTRWTGPDGLGVRVAEHVASTVVAVALAAIVAVPAGWWVGHTHRGRAVAVGLSGATRALPTLGLVTLVGIVAGIGWVGPLVAFVALALPSVLAGAYAGVEAVAPATVDAARATGMTEFQVLTRVEIPLGLPLLVGGVRSAFLQVIATATLAAYVGAGGLGRFLFLGLKTQDYPMMLASSFLVVALALAFDVAFALLQRLTTPLGVRRPH